MSKTDMSAVVVSWIAVVVAVAVVLGMVYYAPMVFAKSVLWVEQELYRMAHSTAMEDWQVVGLMVLGVVVGMFAWVAYDEYKKGK
jgi:H+/Cl- antiporter ClcA